MANGAVTTMMPRASGSSSSSSSSIISSSGSGNHSGGQMVSPSKTRPRRRASSASSASSGFARAVAHVVGRWCGCGGQWQVQVPSLGSMLLIMAMLVSFVFLHTEVEFIDGEGEAGGLGDGGVEGGTGRALTGTGGGFWDEGSAITVADGARRGGDGGAEEDDDTPAWQRALEEQRRRRIAKEQADPYGAGRLHGGGGRSGHGHGPLLYGSGGVYSGHNSSSGHARGVWSVNALPVRAGPGGEGRAGEGRGESGADVAELMKRIAREVTIVVCAKTWFGAAQQQMELLLQNVPKGIAIVHWLTGPMDDGVRENLLALKKGNPNLAFREAPPFTSGFAMRNASGEFVRTKYTLFIFNDVVPLHQRWLLELYSFAENHMDNVVAFVPFLWERRRATSANVGARCRKGKLGGGVGTAGNAGNAGGGSSGAGGGDGCKEETMHAHAPCASDMVFDDYSNDGKLYVQRIEDKQVMASRDPSLLEPRESAAAVEDHCVLVRQSFLEEALVFDPRGGYTRQDLDIALTTRYYNYRAFLVPQSQVAILHPSLNFAPSDLLYFVSQSNDDVCTANQVYLRHKWGVVTGQMCRGFVDSVLRSVQWRGKGAMPATQGGQLQLLLAFFSLVGMNRFQMRGLPAWRRPAVVAPVRCKVRDSALCRPVLPWMTTASNFTVMVDAALTLDSVLRQAGGEGPSGSGAGDGAGGSGSMNATAGAVSSAGGQLWMGRAEVHLPLRVNRVEDSWRAGALRDGQLFTVRRGMVKRGDKHPGRRAPELPYLTRMYLPFLLLEFEFEVRALERGGLDSRISRFGVAGSGETAVGGHGPLCFFEGMSVVIQENCMFPSSLASSSSSPDGGTNPAKGYLLHPGGRACLRSSQYYRAYMYVRHVDMDQTPLRMFDKMRRSIQRGLVSGEGGWLEGRRMRTWLTRCMAPVLRRMRIVRCVPGAPESCTTPLPVGAVPHAWQVVLWAWRPQSVRTAQVLLLQPGASRITI